MTDLSHYSRTKTITMQDATQYPDQMKPNGLWVSVDGPDDWATWCREEDFGDIDQQNRFTVMLNQNANILTLSGLEGLLHFTSRYRNTAPSDLALLSVGEWIDWQAVGDDFQGIIIAPYCYTARMKLLWYYGWDCASGCIWDASAIDQITRN